LNLSYTEELVAEYYKHLKDEDDKPRYIVTTHQMFKLKHTKKPVKGWTDIDVLAFGKKDILIIQTKSMANFKQNWSQSKPAIISFFEEALDFVRNQYDVEGKTLRQILIAEVGLSKKNLRDLEQKCIEFRTLKSVTTEFLDILKKRNIKGKEKGVIGAKEESNVTRILIFLIDKFRISPK